MLSRGGEGKLICDSGILLIAGLGIVATYTGFVIGQFKLRYPHIHNMADAGEVMLGPIGREIFGLGQMLFLVFIMGSHILTFRYASTARRWTDR